MTDDFISKPVELKTDPTELIHAVDGQRQPSDEERKRRQHKEPEDEAKDHFEELAEAAEEAHKLLIRNRSPYRFCVYRKGEEVLIDVIVLDESGKTRAVMAKEISHDQFTKWLGAIESGEGLFFDVEG